MTPPARYREYDPFALLYAHYWGSEYHAQAMPLLDRLVLRLLPEGAAILDLCCGDGRVARSLHGQGFRVEGLDGSEEMLKYARRTAPEVPFHLGDARDFQLETRFDAVLSTFDSLNHVLARRDLQKVFRQVHHCLRPGGYFAFDLNREPAYTDLWSHTSGIVDAQVVSVARGDYDKAAGLATCDITLFVQRDGVWQRSDFTLTQRYHPNSFVVSSLVKAGFASIASLDAADDLGMRGDIGRHRTCYLARRG